MNEKPKCPVLLHFGDRDQYIPPEHVKEIRALNPDVQTYVYAADHAFNCDERGGYDQASAELARQRTLAFFAKHLRA
jgi:carboxymethylenebutenolidase